MKKYKRITNPQWKEHYDLFKDCCDCETDCGCCELNHMALIRLAELEDKIESETLIEMPRIIHPNRAEWHVQYQYPSGIIQYDICFSQEQAEAKLKELQNKE